MRQRIGFRLFLYFSAALLAFALILGGLFHMLFLRYLNTHQAEELRHHAQAIATVVENHPSSAVLLPDGEEEAASPSQEKIPPSMERGRGMRHGMGHRSSLQKDASPVPSDVQTSATTPRTYCRRTYQENFPDTPSKSGQYLKELNTIAHGEVWLVDAKTRTFSLYGPENTTSYDEFPEKADAMLDQIFHGETILSEDFSPLLPDASVTIGIPLHDKGGNIQGALLLHRTLKELQTAQNDSRKLLALSFVAALLISLFLAYLLSRRFVRPLQHMERLATELAGGNYGARSPVHREDEIGSLSKSLDTLAARLEEAEKEQRKFLRMRQDFITNISHELRTPITVLRGTLELISSGFVTDEEKRQGYREQMMTNIISLQRLVNDLFELSRLQNSDFCMEKSPLNLGDALSDALQTASQLAKPKNIDLRLPTDAFVLPMEGDYDRLRQMFLTILDNAVKFSPEHSSIDILARRSESSWSISIRDHGKGIRDEELPHIFQRFYSQRNAANPGGTGLGLPIAREIARRHGISLQCQNAKEGGACFTFSQRKSTFSEDEPRKKER